MSRTYDEAPPPSPLEAVRYRRLRVADPDGKSASLKHVLIFDFTKFTPAVMLGADDKRWDRTAMHGEGLHESISTIPLGNLARWIYQEEQRFWQDFGRTTDADGYEHLDDLASALVFAFRSSPLNDPAVLDGIVEEHGYVNARLPDDHPQGPGAPVELWLEVDEELAGFMSWYDVQAKELEKRRVEEECQPLKESTLGQAHAWMKLIERSQGRTRQKLSSCLSAFATGAAVLDAVETFARPKEERIKLWPKHENAGYNFVYPKPSDEVRDNQRRFEREWHSELLGRAATVIRNAEVREHEAEAARRFVKGLREPGAVYIEMLQNYPTLRPGSKAILRETLLNGIKRCLTVPETRKELGENELAALAQRSASLPGAAPPPPSGVMSRAEKRLREALASYDPSLLAPKNPTPLEKFAAEKLISANDWLERGGMMLDVLALATPLLVTKSGAAQDDVHPAAAWLWKTLMGTCKFTEREAVSFWPWRNETQKGFTDIERVEKSIFHKVGAKAEPLFQLAHVAARTLHLYYAMQEFKDASEERPLKTMEAAESLLKFSQTLVGLAGQRHDTIKAVFDIDVNVGGAEKIAARIGLVTDVIAFAIAFQKWKAAKRKGGPARLREKERMDLLLEYVSLALALLTAAAGAELLLLAAVVAFAKVLLTDLDAWMPKVVPSLGVKPATHRYLEGLLYALLKEDEGYANARKTLKNDEMTGLGRAIYDMWTDLSTPPMDSTQYMWDVTGPPGAGLGSTTKKILEDHWKGRLSQDAILKITS